MAMMLIDDVVVDKNDDVVLLDTWRDMSRQSADMSDDVSDDVVLSSICVHACITRASVPG